MAEKNNKKKISFTDNLVLTYRKLLSLIVFLFLFCLFLCVFYVIGNYKEFLDSSQKLILSWLSVSSIVLGFFSFIVVADCCSIVLRSVPLISYCVAISANFLVCCCNTLGNENSS